MTPNEQDTAKRILDYEKMLDPLALSSTLARAGLFLSGYELLRDTLVDHARDFFIHGFKDGEWIIGPEYSAHVRSLDPDELRASAKWFQKMGALDSHQMDQLAALRAKRNQVAHELPDLLCDCNKGITRGEIEVLYKLVDHLDRWWVLNVEIPTIPDYDGAEVDEAGVVSLRSIWLQHLIRVVTGEGDSQRKP